MSLKYNLQFFADGPGGEKTEPATQKKLSDARKKGQVAKSREVANAFGLLALFLLIKLWVGNLGIQFLELFNLTYNKMPEMVVQWNGFLSYQDIISLLRLPLEMKPVTPHQQMIHMQHWAIVSNFMLRRKSSLLLKSFHLQPEPTSRLHHLRLCLNCLITLTVRQAVSQVLTSIPLSLRWTVRQ